MVGDRIISAGNRFEMTFLMSWITAPVEEVTTPILTGYLGGMRFLSGLNHPFAAISRLHPSIRSARSPAPDGLIWVI